MIEFVVFDTEYTTWEGCIQNGWRGNRKKEIVQLAALKVNAQSLEVTGQFECLVRPLINPQVSDYFVNLTGISHQQVEREGISFVEAYRNFCAFCGDCPCLYHCWNENQVTNGDGEIMEENLRLNQVNDVSRLRYFNIAPWFKQRYAEAGITVEKQAAGEIAAILGVAEDSGRAHNALYDAGSILKGIAYFGGKDLLKLWK